MPQRRELPGGLEAKPFTRAEGRNGGLTASELRGPLLRAPFRGVRVPAALPESLELRCLALSLLLPEQARFDGATAMALLELPLPRLTDGGDPIVVTLPAGSNPVRISGVRAHRDGRRDQPPRLHRSLSLEQPERIWFRLGSDPRLAPDDLVIAADALRDRFSTRPFDEIVGRGLGRSRLATAWSLSRDNVKSPPETRLRLAFCRAGLPEPALNLDIFDRGGGWIARPDLAWPQVKLGVEYDSERHRNSRRQWRGDIMRNRNAEQAGWHLLVATAEDLRFDCANLVAEVADALVARGLRW